LIELGSYKVLEVIGVIHRGLKQYSVDKTSPPVFVDSFVFQVLPSVRDVLGHGDLLSNRPH
jgi:hypothetical protein